MNEKLVIQKEETRDNHETIKINGYYVHSKYKPIDEALHFAEKNYHPHHLHIILGYGLGYIVEALIKKFSFNEPILLVDPLLDQNILKLHSHDYDRLYYMPLNSIEAIEKLADQLGSYTTNIVFIASINYDHIFPLISKEINLFTEELKYKQLTNINTSNYFAMQWQINYMINLQKIENDNSLRILYKHYDVPIVVAASGPSLTKQLNFLREYREKIILICAGSTINALIAAEIEPDYVISVDGGEGNEKQFSSVHLAKAQLIYEPMTHYSVRKRFEKKSFVFTPTVRPGLKNHLERTLKREFPSISGGGSVAHFALSVAKYITKGPICLIGQDLAYTNNQSHADGSKYITNNQQGNLKVEGYNGGEVISSSIFKVMINTFNELQVFEPHTNKVFNCTEGGAKLEQYEQVPFLHFLKEFSNDNVTIQRNMDLEFITNEFLMNNEFQVYNEILSLLEQGRNLAEEEQGPSFSKKGIIKLGEIEKKLNSLYKKTCLDMLLEPHIIAAEHRFLPSVNETKEQEFKRVKNYIIQLYTNCYESIKQYRVNLNQVLEKENKNA